MASKYRFDDSYSNVYKYDSDSKTYNFLYSYYEVGIKSSMSEKKKISLTEKKEDKDYQIQLQEEAKHLY